MVSVVKTVYVYRSRKNSVGVAVQRLHHRDLLQASRMKRAVYALFIYNLVAGKKNLLHVADAHCYNNRAEKISSTTDAPDNHNVVIQLRAVVP